MTVQSLSPAVVSLLRQAQGELAHRQFEAAAATLASVLARAPDCTPALGMSGVAAQMQGQHERAAAFFRKAVAHQPRDAALQAGLGIALFEAGDAGGAVTALRRACDLAPDIASGWFNFGRALKLQVRTDEAIEALRRAAQLDPSHVSARLTLADALASVGEADTAAAELRRVLDAHPDNAHAWFALANLKVIPFSLEDATLLQRHFEQAAVPAEDRVLFGFALARALEDQGDYTASFEALQRANRMQRRRVRWDAAEHRVHIGAIQRAFAAALPAPIDLRQGGEVIFIASMPRSGSTLVEQILASHAEIEGANELMDLPHVLDGETRRRSQPFPDWVNDAAAADWQRLGAEYLARTARWRNRKPRFTDKNLGTWKHVGAALAMLPAARVVVVRRDPVETCLACYRRTVISAASAAQVREPLRRDTARSSRYGSLLDGLRRRLQDEGLAKSV